MIKGAVASKRTKEIIKSTSGGKFSDKYEELYEQASIFEQQTDEEEIMFFADLVSSTRQLNILDLGCAEGKLAVALALKGHKVTASDISQNFLERALDTAQRNSVEIGAVRCDIEENDAAYRFWGESFDVIYFMNVIEHLRNPIRALENIRELLNSEGILFIHTPNVFTLNRIARYFLKRKKLMNYYAPQNLADIHLQKYDYLTIEQTLNFAGLRVRRMIPTKLTLPKKSVSSKWLARRFPFLSDTLLLECIRAKPIDMSCQILFWSSASEANKAISAR